MKTCKTYLIGLDIGTSAVKGVAVSADGKQRITGRSPFVYTCREDGSVEISAERYLEACFVLFRDLTAALPADAQIAGVCAASASGNLLLLDEDGTPATPIINWQDTRTQNEPDLVLGADFDTDAYYRSTGWGFDKTGFPLALLCYYKHHKPALLETCSMVCMSTEYLYFRLTGEWGIAPSAGTPFYLIDQQTGQYRRDILAILGIPEEKLPPVLPTGTVLGTVTEKAAEECGLPAGTPVILGTFDHPSAARGVGIRREGQLLLSCGTSWVGFYPINDRSKLTEAQMLIDPFLSEQNGPWAGMTSLSSISARIEMYTRRYIADDDRLYSKLAQLAEESEAGAGGLRINPTEEPDDALILSHPKNHIARAIMEGTVALLAEQLEILAAQGISAREAVMVGGPSECPLWAKLIAEATGMEVHVLHGAYAGSMGSVILAGAAVGIFRNEEEAYKVFAAEE